MNLSLYLTLKQFKSGNQSGFFKTASILSIAGLSIGISALLITLFILNGFERVISDKITLLDGHIRIKHFLNEPYDPREYELENALAKESDLFSYYAYIQNVIQRKLPANRQTHISEKTATSPIVFAFVLDILMLRKAPPRTEPQMS